MKNLIILATYWNESEWIDASLEQINQIDPVEVIICDGCFDTNLPNRSTDGTREKIEYFVKHRPNSRMISAVRTNRRRSLDNMVRELSREPLKNPMRLIMSLKFMLRMNLYRINQALTFAYMSKISNFWKPDTWVMTMDADQFYPDEMIDGFNIVNEPSEYGLLTGNEYTFPNSFQDFTKSYEKRVWNNFPHKIYSNTTIYPTRHLVRENKFSYNYYINCVPQLNLGYYCHYKFRKVKERSIQLGDRVLFDSNKYQDLEPFQASHPSSIIKHCL